MPFLHNLLIISTYSSSLPVLSDPFVDGSDAGSEESYAGSCTTDERSNEDSDQGVFGTDDDIEAELSLTAAEKRFAGEVSVYTFNASSAELNQQVLWSDKENDQPDAAASLVLHGDHIEISSGSDDEDNSPTTRLVPATFRAVKKGKW